MLRRQSPGVDTPMVRVPQLPGRVPTRAGIACAYLSGFVFIAEQNCPPEKHGGEPCACGTVGGPVDIRVIL
jgi:hypothetical protein